MYHPTSISIVALMSLTRIVCGSPVLSRSQPLTESAGSFDLSLTWNEFGFLGDISLGTPPQPITSFVDWTWISQYVFTEKSCHGNESRLYECFAKEQTVFNRSQSSTFQDQSASYPSRTGTLTTYFFFYDDLTVDYVSEVETVGPSTASLTIQAADIENFALTDTPFPFAGVYGLSPVFKGDDKSLQSPFYQAWVAGTWPQPFVAFHYCYNGSTDISKSTCGGYDALQTLGGYNHSLVGGELSWYDIIFLPEINTVDFVYKPALYNYWTLNLTGLSIGGKPQALNESTGAGAVFDHASYGRGAPLSVNAYKELISATAAAPVTLSLPPNNGNQSFYEVDCTKVATFPHIQYQFGESERAWEIVPSNYVDIVDGVCVLNVRTLGDGDMIVGNFGETFAKDKYVVFDFEENKVGLADLNW